MIINPYPKYNNGQLQFDDGRILLREFYSINNDVISKVKEQSKILTESFENKSSSNDTSLFMNCILQKCETVNRNGRWYGRSILEREDRNFQELIKEGRALGHHAHPDSSLVEFMDSSHRVVRTWWNDNTLMGKIEILSSPGYFKFGICSMPGDTILDFLRKGVKMGISSRGVGSLQESSGKNMVQDDFELICYDLVSSPSTPGAFLYDTDETQEMAENIQEQIEKTTFKNHTNSLLNNLDNFLK